MQIEIVNKFQKGLRKGGKKILFYASFFFYAYYILHSFSEYCLEILTFWHFIHMDLH